MARKRKANRRRPQKAATGRIKITPASILGLLIGLALVGMGLFAAIGQKAYGAYYVVALGAVFIAAVCWGMVRRR